MKTLPKLTQPEYDVTLPVTKKKIKIRPFLAKEEKILLMAVESIEKDSSVVKNSLVQIIQNCVITKGINVNDLPAVDVEKIFIELRKRSVSETIDLNFDLRIIFDCSNDKCPETKKVSVRLDDIKIEKFDETANIVKIDATKGIKLKYPSMNSIPTTGNTKTEMLFDTITNIIEIIYDGDEIYNVTDEVKKEDLREWVENLPHEILQKIVAFLTTQPQHVTDIKIVCPICGKEKIHESKGLNDFFI